LIQVSKPPSIARIASRTAGSIGRIFAGCRHERSVPAISCIA
jgi:hypothetical protein